MNVFCFIAISLWVSTWVWWLDSDTVRYAGLSGVLHGLLLLALISSEDYSVKARTLLIGGLVIKTAYEQLPLYNNQPMQQFLGTGIANTVAIKHNTRNKTIYTGRVAGNCAQQAKNSCS